MKFYRLIKQYHWYAKEMSPDVFYPETYDFSGSGYTVAKFVETFPDDWEEVLDDLIIPKIKFLTDEIL